MSSAGLHQTDYVTLGETVTDLLKSLAKLPYWIILLIAGVVLIALPCVTVGDHSWKTHSPDTLLLVIVGLALVALSVLAFALTPWLNRAASHAEASAGLDLSRVKEDQGTLSTTVSGCEIRVISGRIEECAADERTAIVLPCNEYFDDRCVADPRSALGAYAGRVFEGQQEKLISLIQEECKRKFGEGTEQQKTNDERAHSFGAGHCVLITRPLGRSVPIALVSTTTQRASQGLSARISYLFEGMQQLISCLADARIAEVVMPVLGAGHGGVDASLAFVGLVLGIAEAARYGQGMQRLRKVTIVVLKRDASAAPEVDEVVVRRTLALVGSQS
jgi:hypothetical protein